MPKLKEMKPKQVIRLAKRLEKELLKQRKETAKFKKRNNKLTTILNGVDDNITRNSNQISILRKETLSLEDKIKFLENENAQLKQSGENIVKENESLRLNGVMNEAFNKTLEDTLRANEVIIKYLEMKLNIGAKNVKSIR